MSGSNLKEFLKKYNLTTIDFITIVKTHYNGKLYYACGKQFNLIEEMLKILEENHITKKEIIEKYKQLELNKNAKRLTRNKKIF